MNWLILFFVTFNVVIIPVIRPYVSKKRYSIINLTPNMRSRLIQQVMGRTTYKGKVNWVKEGF